MSQRQQSYQVLRYNVVEKIEIDATSHQPTPLQLSASSNMPVYENLFSSIDAAAQANKLTELPVDYPYVENTTQKIQFGVISEATKSEATKSEATKSEATKSECTPPTHILFEVCIEDTPDAKSIVYSVQLPTKEASPSQRFFRLSNYEVTPQQLLDILGLASYPFKITYCEDKEEPEDNYMTTPVHSIPLSQFEVYIQNP